MSFKPKLKRDKAIDLNVASSTPESLHLLEKTSRSEIIRPVPQFVENEKVQAQMDSLKKNPQIERVFQLLWEKDPDTYKHCHRVADMSQAIGMALGLSSLERSEIYLCGLLHDIGKLFTPDSVLKKPGPLTQDEFHVMKLHPVDSGKLVSTLKDVGYLAAPIRAHHERIDGKGYPDSLVSQTIPLYSRIVLVADTFDAMTNNRVYRKQLDLERTYEELNRCSGSQFDPEVAKKFVEFHEKFTLYGFDYFKAKKVA
jgi:HD-GYP domain-containing protein (c-di-GMP phosphodiesterase class II)